VLPAIVHRKSSAADGAYRWGEDGLAGFSDDKEYYFYLDNTPTHAYMKYLYKYPQNAYPYSDLVETNKRRTRGHPARGFHEWAADHAQDFAARS
jgi:hypothetical protein